MKQNAQQYLQKTSRVHGGFKPRLASDREGLLRVVVAPKPLLESPWLSLWTPSSSVR